MRPAWATVVLGLFVLVVLTVVLDQAVTCLFVVPLLVGLLLLALGCTMLRAPAESLRARYGFPLALVLAVVASIGPWALLVYSGRSGHPNRVVLPRSLA
jgi:hypothetical protein